MVMSARPGRIKLDRAVPIAHPRHYSVKTTPVFADLKAELTEQVRRSDIASQNATDLRQPGDGPRPPGRHIIGA